VPETNDILTADQVAAMLQTTPAWVLAKVRRRCKDPLPCHRLGKFLRFTRSEVRAWYDQRLTVRKRRR
jgi:predicted DNA-binding transcriptional regulator AlpA